MLERFRIWIVELVWMAMQAEIFTYPIIIKETYLDVYGHVNNATYLTLLEEARWEFITKNGYGLKKILEIGYGPVVLEVMMRYLKELRLKWGRDPH